jgi:hypothetical protein
MQHIKTTNSRGMILNKMYTRILGKKKITHCKAGALCLPPSNPAGNTANDAFPPTVPKSSAADPTWPGLSEVSNPDCRAQHSKVERLCRAPRTVTLRVEPREVSGEARIVVGRMNWMRV